jgi:hypothetical protein
MDSSQDFNSLQEGIQKALISTIKSANRIASHDLAFQRTVNPDVAEQLDDQTSRILDLSTRLLSSAAKACGVKAPKLEDPEDVDMNWRKVVDVVDSVLEKADRALDEYTGLIKQRDNGDSDSVRFFSSRALLRKASNLVTCRIQRQNKPNQRAKSFAMPTSRSRSWTLKSRRTTSPMDLGSPC